MGSRQRLGNLGPRAEAGVDEALALQLLECLAIYCRSPRLDQRIAIMRKTEPGEVLEDAVDMVRAAPPGIEILDPETEFSAAGARMGMPQRRGKSMAEVQPPRRGWSETCDFQDSLHAKGVPGDS
jgi:hypothetical protein